MIHQVTLLIRYFCEMEYVFETRQLGISEEGFHLLRNRFNYQTIEYTDAIQVTIQRGKEVNNWVLLLIFGVAVLSFSIYYTAALMVAWINHEINHIYVEEIVVPVLPALIGAYCIFAAFRKGTIIIIKTGSQTHRYPLRDLVDSKKLTELRNFLRAKVSHYRDETAGN